MTKQWDFVSEKVDLVTFSLVMEHLEDLNSIFAKASGSLSDSGLVYVGELHPFRQYNGSKARFDTDSGTQVVTCFTHHVSDFLNSAGRHQLTLLRLDELSDDDGASATPRIISML